jgi:hypothetical protein
MKLNPPASSSDIEVARDIARRLHQRRRREDRPSAGRRAVEADRQPLAALAPEPVAIAHAPSPPRWEPAAAPPPVLEPPVEEPAPPSWDDAPQDGASDVKEPEDALEALTAEPPATDPGLASAPAIELEEPPASLGVPKAAFEEADAYGGTPEPSPFDGGDALVAPDIEPAQLEGGDEASDEEELFDGPPQPSWGDIIERCMALAHARGALLADPSGALVAVRGEWPDPGPDAIASRLVAMMERTLRDAPTRSVSAPVGGMHLTAWRVPAGERLLTAAFIAETLVKADTRPAIDDEVRRGAA